MSIGRLRKRFPVAAKIALTTAGATAAMVASPIPPGCLSTEASDRRAKELHLTKAGEKRLQAARKGWAAAQARFETTFGQSRAAGLRQMLRALRTL